MRPYVAQDGDGSWYGDCWVMQDPDPSRTEAMAWRWVAERLWRELDFCVCDRRERREQDRRRRQSEGLPPIEIEELGRGPLGDPR